jgi:hypothetical protein
MSDSGALRVRKGERCPVCRAPVRTVPDEPMAGIPVTVDQDPAPPRDGLVSLYRRGTAYWRLTPERAARLLPGDAVYTEHRCEGL